MTRRSDFDRRQAVARLYDEACTAIDKERWQEAVEKLDRVRDIDPDFPGAEYRQRYAHKWYRIAKLLEMGQLYMHSDRWHDALRCFRQILREADEYKNVALLQRICERQLIPPPPVDNRRSLALATTALAMGLFMAALAFEAPDFSVPIPGPSVALLETPPPSATIATTLVEPTVESTPTTATPADETVTPPPLESTLAPPSDMPIPDSTPQINQPVGPISTQRPTFTPRLPTHTPTRFAALPTSTRQPATNTASPPAGSTATSSPGATPYATATAGVTLEATPTSQPPTSTPVPTGGAVFVTDTPAPTPANTSTPVPPTPTATRTPTPVPPPTATRTPTPVPTAAAQFIVANEYNFSPSGMQAQPGTHVRLTLSNQGTLLHSWVLKDSQGHTLEKVTAAAGQNALLDFNAPAAAGVYLFICDVSNHAQLGMTGQLTVR